jgi:hypothetical protein
MRGSKDAAISRGGLINCPTPAARAGGHPTRAARGLPFSPRRCTPSRKRTLASPLPVGITAIERGWLRAPPGLPSSLVRSRRGVVARRCRVLPSSTAIAPLLSCGSSPCLVGQKAARFGLALVFAGRTFGLRQQPACFRRALVRLGGVGRVCGQQHEADGPSQCLHDVVLRETRAPGRHTASDHFGIRSTEMS